MRWGSVEDLCTQVDIKMLDWQQPFVEHFPFTVLGCCLVRMPRVGSIVLITLKGAASCCAHHGWYCYGDSPNPPTALFRVHRLSRANSNAEHCTTRSLGCW